MPEMPTLITHKNILKNKFAEVFIVRGKSVQINVNQLTAKHTLKNTIRNTVKEYLSCPQR
jgi:hypothetical protein